MAHIQGNRTGVAELKSAANAGAAKTMEGMGPMMKMGEGIMHSMGSAMHPSMAKGMAGGAVMSAGSRAGKSALKKFFTHPLTLIGIGIVVGYMAHKYRKTILPASEEEA